MNNSQQQFKRDFNIVTNMKAYFQNNIRQLIQPFEEDPQLGISSNSDYVLVPDLKCMVFNLVDLQRNEFDQQSFNPSIYIPSSTDASSNKFPEILSSQGYESISSNSIEEEF